MSTRLVVVSAGLSTPSSTRFLADLLTTHAVEALSHDGVPPQVDVVELRPLARALADHLVTGFPTGDLATALEAVGSADALIVVTPVFSASYSGLFKTFFDVMEPGLLSGKPVVLGATAGTARHSLVLEHAMRPLFAYLRAVPVPTAVFAATEDFGSEAGSSLDARATRAAGELAALLGGGLRATAPRDEFADPVPFAELLGRV
ncbi:FMN reductase [Nocardioides daphniae]|uniref:NADPH-dependent FMN reductase n=1 Tax=Nocardioides daphniae TaxID=402297 RepID=A0A4P7UD86_9ACTN|nr:FMN reductase [Nocardioides daphniae]QCC77278.1 NADPH-dependent FMN reductase [Nocardioides daphniae]GGD25808.1 oxidoreductase [Nocardioides daphniae]